MDQREIVKFQLKDFKNDYRLRALLSFFPKKNGKVLDLGSGNGEMATLLIRFSEFVLATDNDQNIIDKLKQKTKKFKKIRVAKINAEKFSLKEKGFDLVSACDLAEHLKNDQALFNQCYRHLRIKGKLLVVVPAGKFLYGNRDLKLGHYRRYSKKSLIQKVEKAGFRVIVCQYWNFFGLIPYLVSEKIFKKPLRGPARHNVTSLSKKTINRAIYYWLLLERKIVVKS